MSECIHEPISYGDQRILYRCFKCGRSTYGDELFRVDNSKDSSPDKSNDLNNNPPDKDKSISESLADLTKSFEKVIQENSKLVQGPAIQITDLSLAYNHMFSPASERGMQTKVKSLNPEREIKVLNTTQLKVFDKVEYFAAVAVGKKNIVKAARQICELINKYSAKGYITGCLQPLSVMELPVEPFRLEEYTVLCFVSMTEEGSKELALEKSPLHKKEDEMPQHKIFDPFSE